MRDLPLKLGEGMKCAMINVLNDRLGYIHDRFALKAKLDEKSCSMRMERQLEVVLHNLKHSSRIVNDNLKERLEEEQLMLSVSLDRHKAVVPHVSPIERALINILREPGFTDEECKRITAAAMVLSEGLETETQKLWKEPDRKIMKYCVVMEKMISKARSRSDLAQEAAKDEAFKLWNMRLEFLLMNLNVGWKNFVRRWNSDVAEFVALIKKSKREMKDFCESQFVATDKYLQKIAIGTVICVNGAFIFASTRQSVKEDHGPSP
ncbi:hypothetical protein NL676_015390 [Syzygium grande]|nr:hypothetical protein NL676_015390 [Syzygium grande]